MSVETPICTIVPSYNAEATLGRVIERLIPVSPHVLVVDDGSEDNTSGVAADYRTQGVEILRHDKNQGKGSALRTGFDWAMQHGFELAVTMDSDLQHAPEELPHLLDVFRAGGLDILVGSRLHNAGHMPLVRRIGNRFSSWVASRFCHQWIQDCQCGYRIYRLPPLAQVVRSLSSTRFDTETEILVKAALERLRIGFESVCVIYPRDGYRTYYRPFWDTSLIVWFYTKELCRRVFTPYGRKEIREFKRHLRYLPQHLERSS